MRKKFSTNTTISIELKIFLLGFGHFAYPRLIPFSHLTFAQWVQKFNNFLLKLVDIFRFFVININIAIRILSILRGADFKWFCFDGKLFQQLFNFNHVLQRKFSHIERDVRKIIFAVQNKQAILIFQLFAYRDCSLRNFCGRIYDNIKRFCFHFHMIKKFSSLKMRNREFVFTPKIEYELIAERSEAKQNSLTFPDWCVEQDSNLRSPKARDLQSRAIDRSAIHAKERTRANAQNRTADLLLTMELLYRLSYVGACFILIL